MKLDLFRDVLNLNQAFEQVIRALERMENSRLFQTDSLRYARAEVEAARVDANREFFDRFGAIVENDAQWAYRFRRDYDRKSKDPFDFYLELQEREQARKKKGLPPRAVLLPGWDQDDDRKPVNNMASDVKTLHSKRQSRHQVGVRPSPERRADQ